MRITENARKKNGKSITSYRLIFGCRQARELNLVDENGSGRECLIYKSKNGVLLIPIEQKLDSLSFEGYTTTICKYGDKYYGELNEDPLHRIWSASSLADAKEEFHKLVLKIALPL